MQFDWTLRCLLHRPDLILRMPSSCAESWPKMVCKVTAIIPIWLCICASRSGSAYFHKRSNPDAYELVSYIDILSLMKQNDLNIGLALQANRIEWKYRLGSCVWTLIDKLVSLFIICGVKVPILYEHGPIPWHLKKIESCKGTSTSKFTPITFAKIILPHVVHKTHVHSSFFCYAI